MEKIQLRKKKKRNDNKSNSMLRFCLLYLARDKKTDLSAKQIRKDANAHHSNVNENKFGIQNLGFFFCGGFVEQKLRLQAKLGNTR